MGKIRLFVRDADSMLTILAKQAEPSTLVLLSSPRAPQWIPPSGKLNSLFRPLIKSAIAFSLFVCLFVIIIISVCSKFQINTISLKRATLDANYIIIHLLAPTKPSTLTIFEHPKVDKKRPAFAFQAASKITSNHAYQSYADKRLHQCEAEEST